MLFTYRGLLLLLFFWVDYSVGVEASEVAADPPHGHDLSAVLVALHRPEREEATLIGDVDGVTPVVRDSLMLPSFERLGTESFNWLLRG